jgi:hypothetical protein
MKIVRDVLLCLYGDANSMVLVGVGVVGFGVG